MKRLMLIEDNPDNRLLLRFLLEGRYELQDFDNGPDGLAALRARMPELLLLDISLPGMDGLAVLKEIRANPDWLGLPVIALTAHAMSGDRDRYLALGFSDYVSKPIEDERILFQVLERWLGG